MVEHPWRRLRAMPHVRLVWRRLPGVLGLTDGRSVVVLHPDQSQAQRRCTLAHELAHIELGHVGGCTPAQEREVRALVARRLVPDDALLAAWRWTRHPRELADELGVDVATVLDRLAGLDEAERARLRAVDDGVA
ncbi:ImmA/IrrE family metallo-endopeptidase [Cellulomonas iranensis]|uniref:ImmA/IrrE family metallo-endopeptidase n=1 Tax=Cellulomonas iranensis TaxID=76862 RepID=UPI00211B248D|nr:ImmA/IrrE family metallo-endopeptidase [Cellulomonas iranensis]